MLQLDIRFSADYFTAIREVTARVLETPTVSGLVRSTTTASTPVPAIALPPPPPPAASTTAADTTATISEKDRQSADEVHTSVNALLNNTKDAGTAAAAAAAGEERFFDMLSQPDHYEVNARTTVMLLQLKRSREKESAEQAHQFFDRLPREYRTADAYHTLLRHAIECNEYGRAQYILTRMREEGIERRSGAIALQLVSVEKRAKALSDRIGPLSAANTAVPEVRAAIDALRIEAETLWIEAVSEHLPQPRTHWRLSPRLTPTVLSTAVRAHIALSNLPRAYSLIQQCVYMEEIHTPANTLTHTHPLYYTPHAAYELLRHIPQQQLLKERAACEHLIRQCYERASVAQQIVKEMREINPTSPTALLRGEEYAPALYAFTHRYEQLNCERYPQFTAIVETVQSVIGRPAPLPPRVTAAAARKILEQDAARSRPSPARSSSKKAETKPAVQQQNVGARFSKIQDSKLYYSG